MMDGLIVTRHEDLLEITLDCADRGNAMSDDQVAFLGDLVEREHDKVRLIVIRANGDNFCTGRSPIGRKAPATTEALDIRRISDIVFRTYNAVRRSSAPVMTIVKGQAMGFGCSLACVSDITIAAESATFGIPEFSHNIMPTMVMSSLIDRVALKPLMYLVWTSKVIDARRAMMIGAVSDVVPDAELEATAQGVIDKIMKGPRPAVLATKEYAHMANPIDGNKAIAFARSLHAVVNSSSEMRPKKA